MFHAVSLTDSKAQIVRCGDELAVARTTFCLLERHGHAEGNEG